MCLQWVTRTVRMKIVKLVAIKTVSPQRHAEGVTPILGLACQQGSIHRVLYNTLAFHCSGGDRLEGRKKDIPNVTPTLRPDKSQFKWLDSAASTDASCLLTNLVSSHVRGP
jgi:hypothetical protein